MRGLIGPVTTRRMPELFEFTRRTGIGGRRGGTAPDALDESGALPAAAARVARKLAEGPSFAHGMTKTMPAQQWSIKIDPEIEAEGQVQAICRQTGDFRRACCKAFAAKRKPVFGGD